MSYLRDWMDAERNANPDKFDAEMGRVWFRHQMRLIALATFEVSADVRDAAERLEEILR